MRCRGRRFTRNAESYVLCIDFQEHAATTLTLALPGIPIAATPHETPVRCSAKAARANARIHMNCLFQAGRTKRGWKLQAVPLACPRDSPFTCGLVSHTTNAYNMMRRIACSPYDKSTTVESHDLTYFQAGQVAPFCRVGSKPATGAGWNNFWSCRAINIGCCLRPLCYARSLRERQGK